MSKFECHFVPELMSLLQMFRIFWLVLVLIHELPLGILRIWKLVDMVKRSVYLSLHNFLEYELDMVAEVTVLMKISYDR